MITIILDSPCKYLSGEGRRTSILQAALGAGTVLDYLAFLSSGVNGGAIHILTQPDADGGYVADLQTAAKSRANLCKPADLDSILRSLEPSDWVLVLNPRCWPVRGLDLSTFTTEQNRHFGAWYAVPLGALRDGTEERVHSDERGRVQSIRRYYDHVTRLDSPGGMLPCALVRACVVRPDDFGSIQQLRINLASRGVLSRDVPIQTDIVDLSEERGLLAVNERMLTASPWLEMPPGFSRVDSAILCGRGALIHDSADLVPPIIIQPGALIEENVTIIGPTVIGAGSTIGRDALIAQSVIPAGATVSAGARVRHSAGAGLGPAQDAREDFEDSEAYEPPLDESQGEDVHAGAVLPSAEPLHLKRGYLTVKRALDSIVAGAGLILLSPLMLVIAILIKIDSRGPVFFRHRRERAGGGREFGCVKYRTMRADAHQLQRQLAAASQVDGPHFKIRNDPRVTRIGRLLRATNLDELPQLINVLVGDMSLVGPRPSPFRENQVCVPWRRARLSVRPGITGLWQICRSNRGDGDFQEWIFYDIAYVRHLSLWVDLKIFIATFISLGGRWPVPLRWIIARQKPTEGPRMRFTAMASTNSRGTRADPISVGR